MQESIFDKLSIGILTGGKSSRMGKDKALLKINNETYIKRLTEEMGDFKDLLVSASKKGLYESFSKVTVYDEHDSIGPIEGIRQVLKSAKNEYVFICAIDMPFITKELVSYMSEFISSDYDCYVIADEDHLQPLCAIYSKKCLPVIEKLITEKSYRLFNIFKSVRTKFISLKFSCFDKKTVKNINTKDEYMKAVFPIVFCVSGYKNTGKTGLIEKIINEYISRGMTVGVLKHDGHDTIEDAVGTDTYRFASAGACITAVTSDTRYAVFSASHDDYEALIDMMKLSKASPQVIILEGFKNSDYPKIEIVRKEIYEKSVCDSSKLICVVTDCLSPDDVECPIFGTGDIEGIFSCLEDYFGLQEEI